MSHRASRAAPPAGARSLASGSGRASGSTDGTLDPQVDIEFVGHHRPRRLRVRDEERVFVCGARKADAVHLTHGTAAAVTSSHVGRIDRSMTAVRLRDGRRHVGVAIRGLADALPRATPADGRACDTLAGQVQRARPDAAGNPRSCWRGPSRARRFVETQGHCVTPRQTNASGTRLADRVKVTDRKETLSSKSGFLS